MQDIVFDISHYQGHVDFAAAYAAGMRAVIVKATEGLKYTDPTFNRNVIEAQAAGLLVGAYHFGTGATSGLEQAQHFLSVVGHNQCLTVLDFEDSTSQMSLVEAIEFVLEAQQETGVWPVVYCDRAHAEVLGNSATIKDNCPLWLARYTANAQTPPPSPWGKGFMLWQYTQAGAVAGVSGKCDRDMFMGEDLAEWWALQQINKSQEAGG